MIGRLLELIRPWSRSALFIALVLSVPLLQQLYGVMPELELKYYEHSYIFWAYFFDSLSYLIIIIAVSLGFRKKATPRIYYYGLYLALMYACVELVMTFDFTSQMSLGSICILGIIVSPVFIGLVWIMHKQLGEEALSKLKDRLQENEEAQTILQFNLEELARQLKSIGNKKINNLMLTQALMIKTLENIGNDHDLDRYAPLLERYGKEMMQAARDIQDTAQGPKMISLNT